MTTFTKTQDALLKLHRAVSKDVKKMGWLWETQFIVHRDGVQEISVRLTALSGGRWLTLAEAAFFDYMLPEELDGLLEELNFDLKALKLV